jgi:hypothetical protein
MILLRRGHRAFPIFFGSSPRVRGRREEDEATAFFKSAKGAIPEWVAPSSFLRTRNSVEWWAVNGGKMAAKKQSREKKNVDEDETREQTTAEKHSCSGCDLDCAMCEVDGAKTLRRAACKTLKQQSALITRSLATKAKKGDANCTKLLLMLTDSQPAKEGAKKTKHGGKTAQALAEEPEWSEEEVEMLMKPGTESREPED